MVGDPFAAALWISLLGPAMGDGLDLHDGGGAGPATDLEACR